jgi:hypothetical protein
MKAKRASVSHAAFFNRRQGGNDVGRRRKLIVKLGQRISEQNEILRMIAVSLQGVESHLRHIAVSSNPAPNYQRPLSEYSTFNWPSIGATVLNRDDDDATTVEWNGQILTRRSPGLSAPRAAAGLCVWSLTLPLLFARRVHSAGSRRNQTHSNCGL